MHQTSKATRGTAGMFDGMDVESGLEAFREQVKNDYEKVSKPKLSKWKIALSVVSIGLIPLINAIVALVKTKLTKRTFGNLQKMDQSQTEKVQKYIQEKVPEVPGFGLMFASQQKQLEAQQKIQAATQELQKEKFVKDYQKQRVPIAKQFFAYTEGVPYTAFLI